MSSDFNISAGSSAMPERAVPPTPEIRVQLARLLESPSFRTSKRCSAFLRHVVEESCDGRKDQLKERTLGMAVFEREPDYDTNQDPVVRNTAGQVRKRLAQYYCEPGREREIRIDLPPGSYVPDIYIPTSPVPVGAAVSDHRSAAIRWWMAIAVVLTLAALGILIYRQWPVKQSVTTTDLFWSPLVNHSGAIVLCVGQGHTYKLAAGLDRFFDDPDGAVARQNTKIPLSDVIPVFDRYFGFTDVQSLVRFAGLFSRYGKDVELRGGRATSLADLRGRPVVLIGAFNNSWTLSLTGELRFFFESDSANKLETLQDRLHPENKSWQVRTDLSLNQIPMDYAIVTRVFNATTEQAVVVAAGIRGGGTAAASEFLTNPAYLTQALAEAPAGWEEKNVQIVLTTRIFAGNPGPAQVLATHYW